MRIAIVGGGIGGLAAALHLLREDFDVQVYEQASRIGEIGAGIQISPNASRLLIRLGLKPALDAAGVRPQWVHQRRWDDGRTLQRAPVGAAVEQAFGAPYYHVHRGDLAELLGAAVPAERLHLGHRLAGLEQDGDRVRARFDNGVVVEADLLIGADGIHSRVRHLLFGPERPRFTGCVAWRGLVPAERIRHLDIEVASHNWMGPDAHVVHYWVGAGRYMNVVCVREHGEWTGESWTDPGDVADLLARFAGWHPTVRGLIAAFPETFLWALHDRAPLPHWSAGRVTLLGDACHPMLPMMAQGAAQAIEDGATLAALLRDRPSDVAGALAAYEALHKPRASRLQEASAANRTRFHLPDGPEQERRDAALAAAGDRSIANIGWLYGHDAAAVDAALSVPREHLPRGEDFLLYPPSLQPWAYRIVDRLFAHRVIRRGPVARDLPRGREIAPRCEVAGRSLDVAALMDRNVLAGLLVIRRGQVVLERYGLGLQPHDRWSTMSMVKSMTAVLVGAAIRDGAIGSIDDPLTRHLPELAGTAYDGVTLRHVMTMSSGVRWNEDYTDRDSDVNRYSKSLADKVPGGVLGLMAGLPRAAPPGSTFLYNSGDTYLLGAALTRAVGRPLADYMSEKIWQPAGMERDAFYTLESAGGQEIGGSRAGMTLRDLGRFGLFVLNDGVIDGRRVLPEGWIAASATPAFAVEAPAVPDITHYGYSWWLGDGVMAALGHAGQRLDVFRGEDLVVVTLGAFPQPPFQPPGDHNRRAEVALFTKAVRSLS